MGKSVFGIIHHPERTHEVLIGKKIDGIESILAGCWQFPGGGVENGENIVTAGTREIEEETGLLTHAEAYLGFKRDSKGRELYFQSRRIISGREQAASDLQELRWEHINNVITVCKEAAALWPKELINYLQTPVEQHRYIRHENIDQVWYQQTSD